MLRLIVFLAIAAALAVVGVYLANNPGNVVLEWQGYRLETSIGILILAVLAIGVLLAAICVQTRQESWGYPEATAGAMFLLSSLGAEFLPALEEGNLWVRATMPGTISLEEGNATVNRIRGVLLEFPEVITATSQQGRPDDGTDSAGAFNGEFFLPLRPPEQWRTAPTRDGLVHAFQERLSREFVGVDFSYSQAISDNVQEAASGVKGANAVKVFGPELDIVTRKANEVRQVLATVPGVADLAMSRSLGQPTVAVQIDRARAARYGLGIDDVNQVVQAAIGGREAGRLYEPGGDRNFPVMVRLDAPYRSSLDAIGRIPVGGPRGATLADVSEIRLVSGTSYIYREDASRYLPIRSACAGATPRARWPRRRRRWRSGWSCRPATASTGWASSATSRTRSAAWRWWCRPRSASSSCCSTCSSATCAKPCWSSPSCRCRSSAASRPWPWPGSTSAFRPR